MTRAEDLARRQAGGRMIAVGALFVGLGLVLMALPLFGVGRVAQPRQPANPAPASISAPASITQAAPPSSAAVTTPQQAEAKPNPAEAAPSPSFHPLSEADRTGLAQVGIKISGSSGAVLNGGIIGTDFQDQDVILGNCFVKSVKRYEEITSEVPKLQPSGQWCYRVFRGGRLAMVAGGR